MPQPDPTQNVSALWTRVQPGVSSYINALVPDFHAAEDILQRVAMLAVRKFDEYDPNRPFLAWAIGIARFEVLHYRRSMAREKVMFSGELIESLAESFESQEEQSKEIRRAIGTCIERLSERSKAIFQMRYGEDVPVHEMAERLEMKPNSVSAALMKCRQALRKCLSFQLGDHLWR